VGHNNSCADLGYWFHVDFAVIVRKAFSRCVDCFGNCSAGGRYEFAALVVKKMGDWPQPFLEWIS